MIPQKDSHLERDQGSQSAEQKLESLANQKAPTLAREFYQFLRTNKKWWLGPILIAVAVISFFVLISLSPAAPFIYTLF